MSKKKLFITISIILVISIVIVLLVVSINKDKDMINKNMEIIKDSYNNLSDNVDEYNRIRTELSGKLSDFIYESYEEEHDSYIELLNIYNNNIKNIDENVEKINGRCQFIYSDKDVNKICDSYKKIYEKLINIYIDDINNYNDKITSYNNYKESNIELFGLIYNEYLDYNNDKIYEGKDITDTSVLNENNN